MKRAIFIFDTYEMVYTLEQKIRQCPSFLASNDPVGLMNRLTTDWMAMALVEVKCMVIDHYYVQPPPDIDSVFNDHLRQYENRLYRGFEIPHEFTVNSGKISIYRRDLWLVYHPDRRAIV